MGRVHEADDGMINMATQRDPVIDDGFAIHQRKVWWAEGGRALKALVRAEPNPKESSRLSDGEGSDPDFFRLNVTVGCQRGDFGATPIVCIENPAMIGAFDTAPF